MNTKKTLLLVAAIFLFPLFALILLVIFGGVIIIGFVMVFFGNSVGHMPGPTAVKKLGQPLLWMSYAEQYGHNVPVALIMSVMAHESGGALFVENYNCSNGKAAATQCSSIYKHTHTTSVDAGLMQINSGAWPPPNVPGWVQYKLQNNPFNPQRNISAGASKLFWDLKNYNNHLGQALYAYNGGTAQNGMTYDPSYAPTVEGNLQKYLAAPTVFAWAGGKPIKGVYVLPPSGGDIMAVAAYPHGAPFTYKTAMGPITGKDLIQPSRVEASLPNTPSDSCGFPCKHPVPENDFNMALTTVSTPEYGTYPGSQLWAVKLKPNERAGNGPAVVGRGKINDLSVVATWIWYVPCGKQMCRQEQKAPYQVKVKFG